MAKRSEAYLGELQMDMTPMIDIVFQLITFFMLVTQFVSQEIAVLYLPMADQAQPDKVPDPDRFIVNIDREGHLILRGEVLTGELLAKRLKIEAGRSGLIDNKFSKRKVLIRADRDTLYDFVQQAMMACTKVGIFHVQFAAKELPKDQQ